MEKMQPSKQRSKLVRTPSKLVQTNNQTKPNNPTNKRNMYLEDRKERKFGDLACFHDGVLVAVGGLGDVVHQSFPGRGLCLGVVQGLDFLAGRAPRGADFKDHYVVAFDLVFHLLQRGYML